jgi:hypothetical protein
MALSKQLVQVALGLGLDQKTDAKIQIPGKLTTAENVRFSKDGRIDPRPGWAPSSTQPRKFQRLFAFGNQVLGLATPQAFGEAQTLYRADSQGVWRSAGEMPTVPRAIMRKAHAVANVMFADSAINSNSAYMLIASLNGNPGGSTTCTATLVDNSTNKILDTLTVGAAGLHRVRVVRHPTSTSFLVIVYDGTNIKIYEIDPTQSTLSATLRLTKTPAGFRFDSIDAISAPGNGYVYLAYAATNGATADMTVDQVDPSGWTVAHTNTENVNATIRALCFAVPESTATRITLCVSETTNGSWFKQYSPSNVATVITARTTILNAATDVIAIAAIENTGDTSYPLKVVLQPYLSTDPNYRQIHYKISGAGAVTLVLTNRALALASKMCRVDTARVMFWSQFYDPAASYGAQSAFFLSEFGTQYVPRAMLGQEMSVTKDTDDNFLIYGDLPSLHQSSTNTFRSMAIVAGGIL